MFILRFFLYFLFISGVAQIISLEGYEMMSSATYSESSITEHLQDAFAFISCMLFLYASRIDKKLSIASTLLGALLAMMFVRESDSLLDHYVFDGAWQTIVCLILLCVLIFLWGRFSSIYASLKEYSLQVCFGVFLSGFLTILAFSRMMGRGSFWQSVMGDSYMRVVKNIVEEGIETFGYTLIFISAVELVMLCIRRKRQSALTISI